MNIMLANVRSRIREIGIRKAVGATYREIRIQFLIEAIFISLSGGIVGTILGLGVPIASASSPAYAIPVSIWSVVIALATATSSASSSARSPRPAPPNSTRRIPQVRISPPTRHSHRTRGNCRFLVPPTSLLTLVTQLSSHLTLPHSSPRSILGSVAINLSWQGETKWPPPLRSPPQRPPRTSAASPPPSLFNSVASLHGVSKTFGATRALDELTLTFTLAKSSHCSAPTAPAKQLPSACFSASPAPTAAPSPSSAATPHDPQARVRIGAMLQIARVPETLRVKEHIESLPQLLPRAAHPRSRSCPSPASNDIADRLFGTLSGGQKQRVLFAIATLRQSRSHLPR